MLQNTGLKSQLNQRFAIIFTMNLNTLHNVLENLCIRISFGVDKQKANNREGKRVQTLYNYLFITTITTININIAQKTGDRGKYGLQLIVKFYEKTHYVIPENKIWFSTKSI